ncbi:MAG: serine hydrolase domain-containing protein, partial [Myxococcota bacterium]
MGFTIGRSIVALGLAFALGSGACQNDGEVDAPAGVMSDGPAPIGDGGAGGDDPADEACLALFAALDDGLERAFEAQIAGGVVAAAITPTCGLWQGAEGEAAPGEAMTPDRLVRLASITKTYTAVAILKLVSQGKLSLDDTLDGYNDTVAHADRITMRHLLRHQSGVFNYTDDRAFMNRAIASGLPYSPQTIVDIANARDPDFLPGEGNGYSNTGFTLLGMVLEQVAEQTAGATIREEVLAPYGLDATFLDGDETLPQPLAYGFGPDGEDWTELLHPSVPWTAGAMAGTAADVATFMHGVLRATIMTEAELGEMRDFVEISPGFQRGLGLFSLGPPVTDTLIVG